MKPTAKEALEATFPLVTKYLTTITIPQMVSLITACCLSAKAKATLTGYGTHTQSCIKSVEIAADYIHNRNGNGGIELMPQFVCGELEKVLRETAARDFFTMLTSLHQIEDC